MTPARPPRSTASEILSRIALMTGTRFGRLDIASRVAMDTGVQLGQDVIEILQAELGLGRLNWRLEFQGRLIAAGVPVLDSASLAATVETSPAKVGVELAGKGLMRKGGRLLLGVPRNVAVPCKAGADLWRVANGHLKLPLAKLQQVMADAKIRPRDLPNIFPGKAAAFRGIELRVAIPVGIFKPRRGRKTE